MEFACLLSNAVRLSFFSFVMQIIFFCFFLHTGLEPYINLKCYDFFRFQELAGALETALITPLKELKPDESKGDLQSNFISTDVLLSGLASCYATDIYLSPLGHR